MQKKVIVVFVLLALLICLLVFLCYCFTVEHNFAGYVKKNVFNFPVNGSKNSKPVGKKDAGINSYDQEVEKIASLISLGQEDEFIEKALAEMRAQNYKEALKIYDAVAIADPNNKRVWMNRGTAKSSLKDYNGAIADYTYSIEINPERYTAYFNRAAIYYKLGDWQNALNDINVYIQAGQFEEKYGNNKDDAYFIKGAALTRLGMYDEAVKALLYIKQESVDKHVYNDLARAYEGLGDEKKAGEYREKAKAN